MGLLDDLRNQAQTKKAADEEEAARKANREQYYQDKILPRMIKAYQFFNEFVEHLNYINLETIVDYPLLQDGRLLPLRQEAYTVVIDSSKSLKRIDFTMEGVLDTPVQYEVFGKDAVHKHADRIERYSFRHDRKDRKDPTSMEVVSAKFTLLGPLPLKVTVEADVAQSQIIVTIRNFNEPGFTKYNLTVEQFSDEFLDQVGKFVLRKEDRLFGKSEEISEEAKKKLRDRMIVEARIRQQELLEAEARRMAEEAAEKEKTAKEQLKRLVNTQVSKSKEGLKDMFSKLKKQTNSVMTPEQKQNPAPAQHPQQAALKPPVTQQAKQQSNNTQAMSAPAKQAAATPPAAAPTVPAQKPVSAPAPAAMAQKQPAPVPAAAEPAAKETQAASTPVAPPAKKQTQPPKIFNASPDNPFLQREVAEASAAPDAEQVEGDPQEHSAVESAVKKASSGNPFLQVKPATAPQPEQKTTSTENKQKSSVTAEDLENDLARIIEREKAGTKSSNPFLTAAKPAAQAAEDTGTANPFLQTSKTNEAATKPKPILKPGELNTDLSANLSIAQKDMGAGETPLPESTHPTQNPFLPTEPLDIDVAGNSTPPAGDDNKEKP